MLMFDGPDVADAALTIFRAAAVNIDFRGEDVAGDEGDVPVAPWILLLLLF